MQIPNSFRYHTVLLQRVSVDYYAERCTSYDKSVCPSVSLSQAGIESKLLKLRSRGLHWTVSFFTVNFTANFQMERGVGCRM